MRKPRKPARGPTKPRGMPGLAEDAAPSLGYAPAEFATMTSKGQVTVPKRIREFLSLKTGDEVFFTVEAGRVVLRARNKPIQHLKTILPPPKISATLEEIEETIRESWAGE